MAVLVLRTLHTIIIQIDTKLEKSYPKLQLLAIAKYTVYKHVVTFFWQVITSKFSKKEIQAKKAWRQEFIHTVTSRTEQAFEITMTLYIALYCHTHGLGSMY